MTASFILARSLLVYQVVEMYRLLRNVLFRFPTETAHELALDTLGASERLGLMNIFSKVIPDSPVEVMGLRFPNPVGLAAGLDKSGDYFNALGGLGFGFVEVGTVTPRPQPGNPRPRLFRLTDCDAIINRMGFNNHGVNYLVERVKKRRYQGVIGINLGKNADTPLEFAANDYLYGMQRAYAHADYLTVNLSSPNTPGLRSLQFGEALAKLLASLKRQQTLLAERYNKYVPLAVKIAPDMNEEELRQTAESLLEHQIDAVIATNTTLSRQGVEQSPFASEAGGLSGAPLYDRSNEVIAGLAQVLEQQIPIIGVGGIFSGEDAAAKIEAGASLVQIYTGFIYKGPGLIADAVERIRRLS